MFFSLISMGRFGLSFLLESLWGRFFSLTDLSALQFSKFTVWDVSIFEEVKFQTCIWNSPKVQWADHQKYLKASHPPTFFLALSFFPLWKQRQLLQTRLALPAGNLGSSIGVYWSFRWPFFTVTCWAPAAHLPDGSAGPPAISFASAQCLSYWGFAAAWE